MFEDFQLGDFGNRIPSLSFEVIADEGDVGVGAILSELAGGGAEADCPALLQGFAAMGDSVRGVAEALGGLFPFSVQDDGQVLRLGTAIPEFGVIAGTDLGARIATERRSEAILPGTMSVAHYEPARDYQQGLQRVFDPARGRRDVRIDLPATLDAGRVKAHASAMLKRLRAERTSARIRLPWRYLDIAPGQQLAIPGAAGDWRVSAVAFDRMTLEVDLVQCAIGAVGASPSDPGRNLAQPDLIHGPTSFCLLDLPPIDDTVAATPRVAVAAAGVLPGWRRANLLLSLDDGASWQEAGATAAPAIIGTALTPLPAGSAMIVDESNHVEIELLNGGMVLHDSNADALLGGTNAAMLGKELIQFRKAEPLGEGRYRLSGLLRGRRGTEWAIATHSPGEHFVLLEPEALAFLEIPSGTAMVRVMAVGVQDAVPPERSLERPGHALWPPAPVHLAAIPIEGDEVEIRWIRRSRNGWRWLDGVDAPLVEEGERYVVTLIPDAGITRAVEVNATRFIYNKAVDLAAGATILTASVRQLGSNGPSQAASITFPLE